MKPCPKMQYIVEQLAQKHGIELSVAGAHFRLDLEGFDRLVVENISQQRMLVAHYFAQNGDLVPDPAIVFFTGHASGWIPLGITHALTGPRTYVRMSPDGRLVFDYDLERQAELADFAELWAQNLQEQGWLENGINHVWVTPSADADVCGRMVGCQSTHVGACYGVLWQCAVCQKTVCCAEGTDDHPELCDDCWTATFYAPSAGVNEEEDDVPF
jgi:hypothetical protein